MARTEMPLLLVTCSLSVAEPTSGIGMTVLGGGDTGTAFPPTLPLRMLELPVVLEHWLETTSAVATLANPGTTPFTAVRFATEAALPVLSALAFRIPAVAAGEAAPGRLNTWAEPPGGCTT